MAFKQHLGAEEAARELGISAATLYAYVSRGLIRSEPSPNAARKRLYRREDIELLKQRKAARRNPTQAAERNLSWGLPVLESGLTLISGGRLYYRGLDAIELAATRSVEEVASLIWRGEFSPQWADLFKRAARRLKDLPAQRLKLSGLAPVERFQVILPFAERDDLGAFDPTPAALEETGANIVALLVAAAAGHNNLRAGIAQALQRAWAPNDPAAAETLRTALILLVDHELAVSSFTARCVASAGSTLYAVVEAGLCALRGTRHGGMTVRTEQFLAEVAAARSVRDAVSSWLKRGEPIPGFGHQLYPGGDPRARALLDLLGRRYPDSPAIALARSVATEMRRVSARMLPNVDFAGAVLARALDLPAGAAIAIFALGRTIGWIGHAIEQYRINSLIRPRARYVGPSPSRVSPEGQPGASREPMS